MHDPAAPEACRNCGHRVAGRFCGHCGQENLPLNPSLHETCAAYLHELLDVDGRIFRSVWKLFSAPGFLSREQFEGRRIRWVTPLRLYLIFSVAFFAVAAFAGPRVTITRTAAAPGASARELVDLGFASEADLRAAVGQAYTTWMPRVMFAVVPVFAWLTWVLRRRDGRSYPNHLVFALHAHAAWFGASALAGAIDLLPIPHLGDAFEAAANLYGLLWIAIGLRVAFGGTRGRAARDAAIVFFGYGLAVAGATLAIVLPVIFGRR